MINATMPWRLLFLATASVLVTASLPQTTSGGVHASSKNCIVQKDEIVGITSLNNVLAVASRFQVTLHAIEGPRQSCRKTDEIAFITPVDKFTEFKLLNETSVFYCDTTQCNFCRLDIHKCRPLEINLNKQDLEISTAAATQTADGNKILLRIVFSNGRSILFGFEQPLTIEERIVPAYKGVDVQYLQRHYVATGFSADGFSYFVSSAYQPWEPEDVDHPRDDLKDEGGDPQLLYRVKITRVCDSDGTEKQESRVDISLACPGIDELTNRGVSSATYSPTLRKVFVVFSTNTTDDVICSYTLDEINKRVQHTWDVCQKTTYADTSTCRYPSKDFREYCYIFTRMSEHARKLSCSKYASDPDAPAYDMCRLREYTSSAYRFGWLESYIDLEGTPVAQMDNRGHKYNRVFTDEAHSSLFFTGDDRMARVPIVLDAKKESTQKHSAPTLVRFYKPSSRFAMAHVTSNSFLLTEHVRVIDHEISCTSLYDDCNDLAKGGFSDPLNCLYCSQPDNESGGYVMEHSEKSSCKEPMMTVLYKKCPPVIRETVQSPTRKLEWTITGDSLQTLSNPSVLVCGQHCHIDVATAGEKSLTCTLPSSSVIDSTCSVRLQGKLESNENFSVGKVKSTTDQATQTGPALMRNQKGNGSIGVPFETINSYPRNAARNTYLSTDPSGMPFAANMSPAHAPAYERLFREIDDRLKIPSDHLLLEKQIGKGHFGIVLKGTYNPPDGPTRAVACKTLTGHVTGGISEFVNEGLMMDRFDHPRVMTLVGISFNEERMPIIVTDYMENGDLAKYLRDVKNKPTLRDLLNFTHEIAQGMQYLHDNKFIHRDLAARNCMLDKDLHVKVADFGLCRVATEQDEYLPIHTGREMPLRWMAPEALEREQFTMAGDVWAFGVVIWEVMTRGMNPYPNLQQAYVLFEFLKAGKRMGKPDFCPDILFRVMLDCWHGEPTLRPTFKELPDQIEEIIDVLSSNHRIQMNAEYEQCNSVRNSRAASSSATTPITHHAISHVHSLPMESPDPTPV
ncbi:svh-2 [Pristionchus pacificus]|uniref:Svh-2 n=1 Tax=Pristionchus pacificus TaxID=54126 RepID=A0A2A6BCZ8_PRIPA|nr:svh-2 [Pristionchus pacificus]|eukprot:PDM63749.1 svh-2 [Pristionchus pacificus]